MNQNNGTVIDNFKDFMGLSEMITLWEFLADPTTPKELAVNKNYAIQHLYATKKLPLSAYYGDCPICHAVGGNCALCICPKEYGKNIKLLSFEETSRCHIEVFPYHKWLVASMSYKKCKKSCNLKEDVHIDDVRKAAKDVLDFLKKMKEN